jgi:hypothetical protein
MSDAQMTEKDNVVPLFKTFEEMQRDEEAILADFEKDWHGAFKAFEVASDAVLDDEAPLAKVITTPAPLVALQKSGAIAALSKLDWSLAAEVETMFKNFAAVSAEHRRLKKKIEAGHKAMQNLENARRAAIERRDERMFGHGALRRRSQRFASAHARRNPS